MLAQAGYPNGFQTSLIFANFTNQSIPTAVQGYLKASGIDAQINLVDGGGWSKNRVAGWQGIFYYSMRTVVGYDPIQGMADRLSARTKDFISIVHPEDYEAKLSVAMVETDPAKRQAMAQELESIIVDKYALVTTMHIQPSIVVKTKKVHNANFWEIWTQQWPVEDTWLSK